MEVPDDVLYLFSAQIGGENGSCYLEIPEQELTLGELKAGSSYRVAILSSNSTQTTTEGQRPTQARGASEPPVEVGDQRLVDIEDIGEQG